MYRQLLPTEKRKLRSNTPCVERWVEDTGRGLPTSRQVYRRKRTARGRHGLVAWLNQPLGKWGDLMLLLTCLAIVRVLLSW